MNEEQRDIQIDDFITGNMSVQDQLNFKKELILNSDLAEDVKVSKNLYALFETEEWPPINELNDDGLAYQEFLLSPEATIINQAITKANDEYRRFSITPRRTYKWYAIASSFVILLALSYTLFFNNEFTPEKLYADYSDLSNLPSLTLRNDADKLLSEAEQLFIEKEYTGALRAIELYEAKYTTSNPYKDLYKGICYLELNKYEKATNTFTDLKNSSSLDSDKAYWYLAMVHLKQKDIPTTKKYLNKIIEHNYFNKAKANQLLLQLD